MQEKQGNHSGFEKYCVKLQKFLAKPKSKAMSFEIKGKVLKILEEQTGASKNGEWKRKDFVVETAEAYPKKVCFALWNEKIKQLETESVEVGDEVRVMFNVASREYNGKWYSDITAYQIDNLTRKEQEKGGIISPQPENETINLDILAAEGQDDDLPF